jgi:hypothetical protein
VLSDEYSLQSVIGSQSGSVHTYIFLVGFAITVLLLFSGNPGAKILQVKLPFQWHNYKMRDYKLIRVFG